MLNLLKGPYDISYENMLIDSIVNNIILTFKITMRFLLSKKNKGKKKKPQLINIYDNNPKIVKSHWVGLVKNIFLV